MESDIQKYIDMLNKQQYDLILNLLTKKDQHNLELEKEFVELKLKYDACEKERLLNRMDYLTMKNKWLNSEQQLAELKEKAIVPRFKIGQKVWWIDKRLNNYNEKEYEIVSYLIDSIVVTSKQFRYYGNDGYWHGDDELYTTEQEAQEKLKELDGNE